MIKIQVIASDHFDYLGDHSFNFNEVVLNGPNQFPLSNHIGTVLSLVIDTKNLHLNYQILDTSTKLIKLNGKIAPISGTCQKNDILQLGVLKLQIIDFAAEVPYDREADWKRVLQDPRHKQPSAQAVQKLLLEEDD
jgi:hypothetical protein